MGAGLWRKQKETVEELLSVPGSSAGADSLGLTDLSVRLGLVVANLKQQGPS